MEVEVQVERAPEALHEVHRSTAAIDDPSVSRSAAEPSEERPQEDPAYETTQGGVIGEQEADPVREGEHPLAHADRGQDAIGQVRGRLGHAPAAAGGTEAAALAGEGHQGVLATARAVNAGEAVGQHAAFEEAQELALDEARKGGAGLVVAGARQEGQVGAQG